jgi:hypothetical protein
VDGVEVGGLPVAQVLLHTVQHDTGDLAGETPQAGRSCSPA